MEQYILSTVLEAIKIIILGYVAIQLSRLNDKIK